MWNETILVFTNIANFQFQKIYVHLTYDGNVTVAAQSQQPLVICASVVDTICVVETIKHIKVKLNQNGKIIEH